jgi:Ulp1 protease family, C-terminal catalytic domain
VLKLVQVCNAKYSVVLLLLLLVTLMLHIALCMSYTYHRTKKFDVFALDKVIIPANVGNMHWCLAVVYVQEGRIQYYDRYIAYIYAIEE